MSDYIVKDTELTSVANVIRTKGGTNLPLVFPNGFVTAVNNISGGGGSSDFSTANLQVVNQGGYPTNLRFATIRNNIATIGGYPENTDSGTYPVILYKGLAGLTVELLSRGNISISGSIESLGNNFYTITGDCTITIS